MINKLKVTLYYQLLHSPHKYDLWSHIVVVSSLTQITELKISIFIYTIILWAAFTFSTIA